MTEYPDGVVAVKVHESAGSQEACRRSVKIGRPGSICLTLLKATDLQSGLKAALVGAEPGRTFNPRLGYRAHWRFEALACIDPRPVTRLRERLTHDRSQQ